MKAKDVIVFLQTNPNAEVLFSAGTNPPIPAAPIHFAFSNKANAYLIESPVVAPAPQPTPPPPAPPTPPASSSTTAPAPKPKPPQKGQHEQSKKSTMPRGSTR